MTRGQKGCYIYCTNKELADYFKLAYNHQLSYTYNEPQAILVAQPIAADKTNSNIDKFNPKSHES